MPDELLFDPNLIPALDVASAAFAEARGALAEGDHPIDNDQAVWAFQACLNAQKNLLANIWNMQTEEENANLALLEQQRTQERDARQAEEDAERCELDKKRPKFAPIAKDIFVTCNGLPPLCQYASKRLLRLEYVPLWYFTGEATTEAS